MCIFHNDVRLCKVKDDGKFRIVKKVSHFNCCFTRPTERHRTDAPLSFCLQTCFKCGTAGLIPKDSHKAKTHVHGYKTKDVPKRQQLADKLQGLSSRNLVPDEQRPLESKGSKKKTPTRGEQRQPTSRSRTLSPLRPKTQRSPKPTSAGRGRREMPNDLIEYPFPPPPFPTGITFTPTTSRKHGNASSALPRYASREIKVEKISNGFGFGHCSIHPHVKLAIIRTTRGDGSWDIRKESCPLCPDTRGRLDTFGDNAPSSCLPATSESPKPSGITFVRCSSGPSTMKPLTLAPQSPNDVTEVSACLALAPLKNSNTRIAKRKKIKERAERENAPWPVSKNGT